MSAHKGIAELSELTEATAEQMAVYVAMCTSNVDDVDDEGQTRIVGAAMTALHGLLAALRRASPGLTNSTSALSLCDICVISC